jgi:hypothetical protein
VDWEVGAHQFPSYSFHIPELPVVNEGSGIEVTRKCNNPFVHDLVFKSFESLWHSNAIQGQPNSLQIQQR